MSSSFQHLQSEIDHLKTSVQANKEEQREVINKLEMEHHRFNKVNSKTSFQKKEFKRLLNCIKHSKDITKVERDKLKTHLDNIKSEKNWDNSGLFTQRRSLFLEYVLGKVDLRIFNQEEKLNLKDQYNKFKLRTAIIFILLPLIQIVFNLGPLYVIIHHFWVLYLYLSLALRENILFINGSQIQSWWIYHHYISSFVAVISITLCHEIDRIPIYTEVLWLFILQGIVMFMQYLYQSRRHYARVATGKASPLDVALSETLVEVPSSLCILVPLLIFTHVCEVYLGMNIFLFSRVAPVSGFKLSIIGVLIATMGLGNFFTLLTVIIKKKM